MKDKDVVIGPGKPKGLAKIHGSERGKEEGNGPRKPKAWNRLAQWECWLVKPKRRKM